MLMAKGASVVGQSAPPFALKAVATGRLFSPADYRGRVVLLLFADQHTGRGTQAVVEQLRRAYPRFEQLVIALVIDARVVPRLFRGTAEGMMEREYRETARQIPQGYDPAEHLILLPDWKGEVVAAYGVGDLSRHAHAVCLGPDGVVRGEYSGPDAVKGALELVRAQLGSD